MLLLLVQNDIAFDMVYDDSVIMTGYLDGRCNSELYFADVSDGCRG